MYIYKITHKSTHQAYVGQTKNFLERWAAHFHSNDSPIQKAIKEEGVAAFTFEVLEECEDGLSDEREVFWIKFFHTYENGYNTNQGNNLKVETPKKEEKIILPTLKPSKAKNQRGNVNSPDGVDAYDPKTGELVAHYPTIADANRALGKEGTGNISAVCRGRGRTAYGYIWKYTTPQN